MTERYPEPPQAETRSTAYKIGRRALAASFVTISLAVGAVGGYELAEVIDKVLAPGLQHQANKIFDDILDSQQP